jgi:hypothetical protein
MLSTVFSVLIVLWVVGVATSFTLGGFIHILLGLAVIILLIGVIQSRKTVS